MPDIGVIRLTSSDDLTWYRRQQQDLLLADALDGSTDARMTVGFARYGAGEANPWTMTYDEALVITKGRFTVESAGIETTARPGEVIYLHSGTELRYRADEATELVYITYPHWMQATEASPFAHRLSEFQADGTPRNPQGR